MSEPLITQYKYSISEESESLEIRSQIKDECLAEITVNFILDFINTIKKRNLPEVPVQVRDTYTITFALHLEDDHFTYSHDCGDHSLLVGILTRIVNLISVKSPAEYRAKDTDGKATDKSSNGL